MLPVQNFFGGGGVRWRLHLFFLNKQIKSISSFVMIWPTAKHMTNMGIQTIANRRILFLWEQLLMQDVNSQRLNVSNSEPFSSSRMPCISQATRTRTTCRQSLTAARWSARPSTTTWCANGGLAPTPTTCSTWLEPMNQQRDSWSVSTAWPLCPSTTSPERNPNIDGVWSRLLLGWSFRTEDRAAGGKQDKELQLCALICPPCKRWS